MFVMFGQDVNRTGIRKFKIAPESKMSWEQVHIHH